MAHVIVADPDYSIRKLLKHVVALLGWTCDTTASGPRAWQLVQELRPDLVIAEVDLSRMTGVELAWSMKLHPSLSGIPVVLTSSAHGEDQARCAGCAAFLAKPFHIDELLQLLTTLAAVEERD